jgi:hypothetical protein
VPSLNPEIGIISLECRLLAETQALKPRPRAQRQYFLGPDLIVSHIFLLDIEVAPPRQDRPYIEPPRDSGPVGRTQFSRGTEVEDRRQRIEDRLSSLTIFDPPSSILLSSILSLFLPCVSAREKSVELIWNLSLHATWNCVRCDLASLALLTAISWLE